MSGKRRKKRSVKKKPLWSIAVLALLGVLSGYPRMLPEQEDIPAVSGDAIVSGYVKADITVPAYAGEPYAAINGNVPFFAEGERLCTEAFEYYSELDSLGRCGMTVANVCTELMPTEERGQIGQIKPSGWHTVKYDCIADRYLYNRCHLIGFQLAGENANVNNLITGTRYLNMEGMLPFENMVAGYVQETNNHVLYRAVPYFSGENLVADGVLMEGWSVEDGGAGVCFCIFAYNVQPGIEIDYATGDSCESRD